MICPEASCVGRCGASSGDGRGRCSCDRRCWFLDDCCLDAPLHCFGASDTDISKIQPPPDLLPPEDVAWMRFAKYEFLTIGKITPSTTNEYTVQTMHLIMVAGCSSFDNACEGSSFLGAKYFLPVCVPKLDLIFVNVFCAFCNGFQSHEVVSFESWLEVCPAWLAFNYTMDELFHNKTLVDLFHIKCYQSNFFIPEACQVAASRNHHYYISLNPDDLACFFFDNPMYVNDSTGKTIFRNQFCADESPDKFSCVSNSTNFDEFKSTLNNPLAVKVDSNGILVVSYINTNVHHESGSIEEPTSCGKQSCFLLTSTIVFLFLSSVMIAESFPWNDITILDAEHLIYGDNIKLWSHLGASWVVPRTTMRKPGPCRNIKTFRDGILITVLYL